MSDLREFHVVPTPQGVRPFGVFLPRPIPASFLLFVARHAASLPELTGHTIHLLAVQHSGTPFATAILMHRQARNAKGSSNDHLTLVDPEHPQYLPTEFHDRAVHIIVDNSLKSMGTVKNVVYRLRASNIHSTTLLTLVEYNDDIEQAQRKILEIDYGVRLVSVFKVDDILSAQGLTMSSFASVGSARLI